MSDSTRVSRGPTVTVAMALYNQRRYVVEAVESILGQAYRDFELLLIDDGSTDGSGDLVRRRFSSEPRLRMLRQANSGRAATRARALREARGLFVATMDPDDVSTPDRLAAHVAYLQSHTECVAVGSQYQRMCPRGVLLGAPSSLPLGHEEIERELLTGRGDCLTQGASLFRRDVALAVGGYCVPCEWGEDLDLFLRMARAGRLANLPDVHLHYRQHLSSSNSTHSATDRARLATILDEACRVRGLPSPSAQRLDWAPPARWELLCCFGWNALSRGRRGVASGYALEAIQSRPRFLGAFRLLACTIRGH
jgi:glycosyltransferase involved in cell wall biosynthesis